jgi:succinoglycan biosynthesis transport protein ExoP
MTTMSDFTYVTTEQTGSPVSLLMRMVRRRIWLIAVCVLAATVTSVLIALTATPLYQAKTMVMLDNRQRATGAPDSTVIASLPSVSEPALVRSEMTLLSSPTLVASVISELKLQNHPEFNEPPGVVDNLKAQLNPVKDWIRALLGTSRTSPVSDSSNADLNKAATGVNIGLGKSLQMTALNEIPEGVIRAYQERLSVVNDGRSYVIQLAFQAEDPALAAAIINAHAQAYIRNQIEVKFEATRQVSHWLNEQLQQVQGRLKEAESKAQQYRSQHGLAAELGVNSAQQQLEGMNRQITTLEVAVSEKESQLAEVRRVRDAPSGSEAANAVVSSPLIQQLREQEAMLLQENTRLLSTLGPRHPDLIRVQAQLANLRGKIRAEADRIADGLQAELGAARSNLKKMQTRLNEAERQVHGLDAVSINYASLLREVETSRELARSLMSRSEEVSAQMNFQSPDARVVSAATIPTVPAWPRPMLWIIMAAISGAGIGVLLAVLLERSGTGFRNTAEIEQTVQIPVLGVTPMTGRRLLRSHAPADDLIANPRSLYSESLLSIGTLLRRLRGKKAVRTLLVTSCLPQEGKTVFCVSLGRALARMGERVLLIDCDLRRPMVASYVSGDVEVRQGIIALLEGRALPEDVTCIDEGSGLHYLPGEWKGYDKAPGALLSSREFLELLRDAERHYDRIIIDSPPLAAASDALTLAQAASGTIFLVQARTTRRRLVQSALRRLNSAGANILGVVLGSVRYDKDAFTADDLEHHTHQYSRYYTH